MKRMIITLFCIFILGVSFACTKGTGENSTEAARFQNNGNGTISDKRTGLMWQQNGSASGQLNWENANVYCKNLRLAGYSDWRLPTIDEIKKIIHEELPNQHDRLNSQGFSGVDFYIYWSSSVNTLYTNHAWFVYMGYGGVSFENKDYNYNVLAVRLSQ